MMGRAIRIGVIGHGHWGRHLARCFAETEGSELAVVCDRRKEACAAASRRHPSARTTLSVEEVLRDDAIDAVYIATPPTAHEALVLQALEAGKDVLVEKPLAASVAAASRCVERAEALGRVLMVGPTFVYSHGVQKIRELVASGALGRLRYIDAARENLGQHQRDVNVVWDLAPHDLSVVLYATGRRAQAVAAHGGRFAGEDGLEDVARLTLECEDGLVAYLRLSWLSPVKVRRSTFVGDEAMLVYDDLEPTEKLRVFDRRVERGTATRGDRPSYHCGGVECPALPGTEPLVLEARAFLAAVRSRGPAATDGRFGLAIVRILDAATRSLREGGRRVSLV